jgi:hypothetical protein
METDVKQLFKLLEEKHPVAGMILRSTLKTLLTLLFLLVAVLITLCLVITEVVIMAIVTSH